MSDRYAMTFRPTIFSTASTASCRIWRSSVRRIDRTASDSPAAARLSSALVIVSPKTTSTTFRVQRRSGFRRAPAEVGRYTALYIPLGFGRVSAVTRLVPLHALLRQRRWPSRSALLTRLVAYGQTHGAWDDATGYVEGSLARVVEAAAGIPPLPSVKADPGFLCGMEFDTLRSEVRLFERHSLRVEDVQTEIRLSPGELLVFDNLAVAHGRRGVRRPGELHQRVFGESGVRVARQHELRDRVLAAFGDEPTDPESVAACASIP